MLNKGDSDEELNKLPLESVNDRVSRLDLRITENAVVDKPHIKEIKSTKPEVVIEVSSEPHEKEASESSIAKGEAELKTSATRDPIVQTSKINQLLEKMLPAFVKIVKPNVQRFNKNPQEYSKFKAAFNVEVDKKEVYGATEKLKFLLDSAEGRAKSCLAKFMPGSDEYEEAWTALRERFGRVDTVVSAAKKRIDQFPTIVKENSVQIRQYQGIVSELIGIFKEHNFLHQLSSQLPEATVAKLPARLCGRWAEFVKGKPKLSTWNSFAN